MYNKENTDYNCICHCHCQRCCRPCSSSQLDEECVSYNKNILSPLNNRRYSRHNIAIRSNNCKTGIAINLNKINNSTNFNHASEINRQIPTRTSARKSSDLNSSSFSISKIAQYLNMRNTVAIDSSNSMFLDTEINAKRRKRKIKVRISPALHFGLPQLSYSKRQNSFTTYKNKKKWLLYSLWRLLLFTVIFALCNVLATCRDVVVTKLEKDHISQKRQIVKPYDYFNFRLQYFQFFGSRRKRETPDKSNNDLASAGTVIGLEQKASTLGFEHHNNELSISPYNNESLNYNESSIVESPFDSASSIQFRRWIALNSKEFVIVPRGKIHELIRIDKNRTRSIRLKCEVILQRDKSFPSSKLEIAWYRVADDLRLTDPDSNSDTTILELFAQPESGQHGFENADYHCVARVVTVDRKNQYDNKTISTTKKLELQPGYFGALSRSIKIRILEKPKTEFISTNPINTTYNEVDDEIGEPVIEKRVEMHVGEEHILECAHSDVIYVRWYHADNSTRFDALFREGAEQFMNILKEKKLSEITILDESGTALRLVHNGTQQLGSYACEAFDESGQRVLTRRFNIISMEDLYHELDSYITLLRRVGTPVKLSCAIYHGERTHSVRWYHNGLPFNIHPRAKLNLLHKPDYVDSQLILSIVEPEDQGLYDCVVTAEDGGERIKRIRMRVDTPSQSERIERVRVAVDHVRACVTVTFRVPQEAGDPSAASRTTYFLVYYPADGSVPLNNVPFNGAQCRYAREENALNEDSIPIQKLIIQKGVILRNANAYSQDGIADAATIISLPVECTISSCGHGDHNVFMEAGLPYVFRVSMVIEKDANEEKGSVQDATHLPRITPLSEPLITNAWDAYSQKAVPLEAIFKQEERQLVLHWQEPSYEELRGQLTGYEVELSEDRVDGRNSWKTAKLNASSTLYQIENVSEQFSYRVRVVPLTRAGAPPKMHMYMASNFAFTVFNAILFGKNFGEKHDNESRLVADESIAAPPYFNAWQTEAGMARVSISWRVSDEDEHPFRQYVIVGFAEAPRHSQSYSAGQRIGNDARVNEIRTLRVDYMRGTFEIGLEAKMKLGQVYQICAAVERVSDLYRRGFWRCSRVHLQNDEIPTANYIMNPEKYDTTNPPANWEELMPNEASERNILTSYKLPKIAFNRYTIMIGVACVLLVLFLLVCGASTCILMQIRLVRPGSLLNLRNYNVHVIPGTLDLIERERIRPSKPTMRVLHTGLEIYGIFDEYGDSHDFAPPLVRTPSPSCWRVADLFTQWLASSKVTRHYNDEDVGASNNSSPLIPRREMFATDTESKLRVSLRKRSFYEDEKRFPLAVAVEVSESAPRAMPAYAASLAQCDTKGGPAGCHPAGSRGFRQRMLEDVAFRRAFIDAARGRRTSLLPAATRHISNDLNALESGNSSSEANSRASALNMSFVTRLMRACYKSNKSNATSYEQKPMSFILRNSPSCDASKFSLSCLITAPNDRRVDPVVISMKNLNRIISEKEFQSSSRFKKENEALVNVYSGVNQSEDPRKEIAKKNVNKTERNNPISSYLLENEKPNHEGKSKLELGLEMEEPMTINALKMSEKLNEMAEKMAIMIVNESTVQSTATIITSVIDSIKLETNNLIDELPKQLVEKALSTIYCFQNKALDTEENDTMDKDEDIVEQSRDDENTVEEDNEPVKISEEEDAINGSAKDKNINTVNMENSKIPNEAKSKKFGNQNSDTVNYKDSFLEDRCETHFIAKFTDSCRNVNGGKEISNRYINGNGENYHRNEKSNENCVRKYSNIEPGKNGFCNFAATYKSNCENIYDKYNDKNGKPIKTPDQNNNNSISKKYSCKNENDESRISGTYGGDNTNKKYNNKNKKSYCNKIETHAADAAAGKASCRDYRNPSMLQPNTISENAVETIGTTVTVQYPNENAIFIQ